MIENGVDCLVLPGRIGAVDDGWFDHAKIMGFATAPLFEMHEIAVFEIDRDRWLQGYLTTNNYQATVTVYRLSVPGSAGR